MREEHFGFALEAGNAIRVVGKLGGQDLQFDIALQRGVVGSVHLAHSALADQRPDLVVPDMFAWGERHEQHPVYPERGRRRRIELCCIASAEPLARWMGGLK